MIIVCVCEMNIINLSPVDAKDIRYTGRFAGAKFPIFLRKIKKNLSPVKLVKT